MLTMATVPLHGGHSADRSHRAEKAPAPMRGSHSADRGPQCHSRRPQCCTFYMSATVLHVLCVSHSADAADSQNKLIAKIRVTELMLYKS